jgi:hypothetical protein
MNGVMSLSTVISIPGACAARLEFLAQLGAGGAVEGLGHIVIESLLRSERPGRAAIG